MWNPTPDTTGGRLVGLYLVSYVRKDLSRRTVQEPFKRESSCCRLEQPKGLGKEYKAVIILWHMLIFMHIHVHIYTYICRYTCFFVGGIVWRGGLALLEGIHLCVGGGRAHMRARAHTKIFLLSKSELSKTAPRNLTCFQENSIT